MTASPNPSGSSSRPRGLQPVLATLLLLCGPTCSVSEGPTAVSSPAVRQQPRPDALEVTLAPLRLAVAAMVSPASTYDAYEELLKELAARLNRPFTLVQRRTYKEINDLLLAGQLDMAFICSGAFASLPRDAPIEVLALPVVGGRATYQSYIIARSDSGFTTLDDLRAKRFAFTDPLSNTGYFYPLSLLREQQMVAADFFAETVFTGSHDRSITAVYRQLVDGAAVDSLVYNQLVVAGSRYQGRLSVIGVSPEFPIPPVVAPAFLPPKLKQGLKEALLTLHQSSEGRERLRRVGFDKFVPGTRAAYEGVRRLTAVGQSSTGP